MKPVLDTPMTAGDVQQPLGGDVFGQEIVAHYRGIGPLTSLAPARSDPAHRRGAWEAVESSQAGVAHDGRAPCFVPIVARRLDLFGDAALARSRKLLRNRSEQAPAVCLDRQNIVAAALADRRRKGTVAMQRVGGNDAVFERQKLEHFQSTRRLVATSRFLLGQSHAGVHRKDIDQLQWRGLSAAFVSSAQGLAVDCHHPGKFEPIGLGKGRHEARNALSKVSGFSRRNTRLKVSWLGMPCSRRRSSRSRPSFGLPELGHVRATVSAPHSTAAKAIPIPPPNRAEHCPPASATPKYLLQLPIHSSAIRIFLKSICTKQ